MDKLGESSRSAAALKAAETRRHRRAEERAKHRRENFQVYDSEEFLSSYLASEHSIDDVLKLCAEMVTDDDCPTPGVVVWLDGELVGAAKRGDEGEAVLTVYDGPYAGWRRVLPN